METAAYSEDNTPAKYNHTKESEIQWLKNEMLEIGLALATASVPTASSVDDHLICTPQDDISALTVTRDVLKEDISKAVTIEKEEESPPEHLECDISTIQTDADCEIGSGEQKLQAKPTAMVQDETTAEVQEDVPDENTAEVQEDVPEEVTAEVQSEVQESTTAEIPEGTTVAVSTETVLVPDLPQKCFLTSVAHLIKHAKLWKPTRVVLKIYSQTRPTTKMVTDLLLLHYFS